MTPRRVFRLILLVIALGLLARNLGWFPSSTPEPAPAQRRDPVVVEVPPEEFDTMGCNVLALGPRHAMMVEGNPETERRMRKAGVKVEVIKGTDICRKGEGGPTCMTRPLVRG